MDYIFSIPKEKEEALAACIIEAVELYFKKEGKENGNEFKTEHLTEQQVLDK